MEPFRAKDIGRFRQKVELIPFSDCHYWTGELNATGYGIFRVYRGDKRTPYLAHRVAFVLANGPVPIDRPHVLHSCDNPMCVNPAHLHAGTPGENMREMQLRRRQRLGERHPRSKISDAGMATVISLIDEGSVSVSEIAAQFGVGVSHISAIRHGNVGPNHPAFGRPKPTGRSDRRLPDGEAAQIYRRARGGERNIDLANEYGVAPSFIADIKRGVTYASVTGHRRLQSAS